MINRAMKNIIPPVKLYVFTSVRVYQVAPKIPKEFCQRNFVVDRVATYLLTLFSNLVDNPPEQEFRNAPACRRQGLWNF